MLLAGSQLVRNGTIGFGLFASLSVACPASARDDSAVNAYAMAFSAAFEARTACSGTEPDQQGLAKLEAATGLSDTPTDNAFLVDAFSRWKKEFQSGMADKGASAWCSGILTIFGPTSMIPVIRKVD